QSTAVLWQLGGRKRPLDPQRPYARTLPTFIRAKGGGDGRKRRRIVRHRGFVFGFHWTDLFALDRAGRRGHVRHKVNAVVNRKRGGHLGALDWRWNRVVGKRKRSVVFFDVTRDRKRLRGNGRVAAKALRQNEVHGLDQFNVG